MNKYLVTLLVLAFLLVGGMLSKQARADLFGDTADIKRSYDQQTGVACYSRHSAQFSCVQVAARGTPEDQL